MMRSRMFGFAFAAVALLAGAAEAAWPEKPINLVIAFEPGGGGDQATLPLKPLLEARLGQKVLFNYKPGAGGRIGFETVFQNGDDGYTIGLLTEPHFTNTTLFDTPRYKHADLTPVGIISRDVPMWFVDKDSPFKNMNDVIAEAKKRPGEVTVAIGSFTGEHYLTLAILEEQAGVKFRPVNVKGGGAVITNVLGGHFDLGVIRPAPLVGVASEIRGLGVVTPARNPSFPDTPTFDEQLPPSIRIPHFSSSRGLMVTTKWATKNPEAFKKLETAYREASQTEEYKSALDRLGLPLEWVDSAAAKKELEMTAVEMGKYKPLVEAAKAR